ncbi:MAG: MlaD family protein [Gammaproteobacteria bacterium]|nr:MAG: MlaD family protein [Gammaproteobacteria bacterium]
MTNPHPDPLSEEAIPEAVTATRSGFSIIWLIPLVAALIGAWVAYKAISERGPVITIVFDSADGLEAGKTKVKFKDVEVGQVEAIDLGADLEHVLVTVEMKAGSEPYLTDRTRFWVVRARISAGNVSGLDTLLSGAYIGLDPVEEGEKTRTFTGLETVPVVTTDQPGQHLVLKATRRGSLDVGAPVYFRQIKVGEVVSYKLAEGGESVDFRIFINAPHHLQVTENTRFWNASGLDLSLTAEGVEVEMESMVSLLIGGIAFEVPEYMRLGEPVPDNSVFTLYDSHEDALVKEVSIKRRYLLYFDSSVRGLSKGAPVEFRGIQLGKVIDIDVEFDAETEEFLIPVLIETEPERLTPVSLLLSEEENLAQMERLVVRGLRAQLKMGNLLTGQLYVDLDFYPDAEFAEIDKSGPYPVMPTTPTSIEEMTRSVKAILKKLEDFPLGEIGDDLTGTFENLNKAITQADNTLQTVNRMFAADSPLTQELQQTLTELAEAARTLRVLADYLDRHPEALIKGKVRP